MIRRFCFKIGTAKHIAYNKLDPLLKGHLLWQNLSLSSKPYVTVFSKIPVDMKTTNSITSDNVCQLFESLCLFHIRKKSTRKSETREKQIKIPPTNPTLTKISDALPCLNYVSPDGGISRALVWAL